MEQQLINALIKLFSKAGGGSMVRDMIQQVEQTGNPKVWTASEITLAIEYVTRQTENFGSAEANVIIEALQKKYNVGPGPEHAEHKPSSRQDLPEVPGIHGLR